MRERPCLALASSLVLALASVVACDGGSPGDAAGGGSGVAIATRACDPFVTTTEPITLETVIAAGRAADGTVYVMEKPAAGEHRAFVSSGMVLQRWKVDGSGEGPDFLAFVLGSAEGPLHIKADLQDGAATRMGILHGRPAEGQKTLTIGAEGEELALLARGDLSGYAIENLPGKIDLELDLRADDGRRLVVTRPDVDWSYEDFRVFFGPPNHLLERRLVSASRGSSTHLTFDVDGVSYDALLPIPMLAPSLQPTLTGGGATLPLTYLTPAYVADPDGGALVPADAGAEPTTTGSPSSASDSIVERACARAHGLPGSLTTSRWTSSRQPPRYSNT